MSPIIYVSIIQESLAVAFFFFFKKPLSQILIFVSLLARCLCTIWLPKYRLYSPLPAEWSVSTYGFLSTNFNLAQPCSAL